MLARTRLHKTKKTFGFGLVLFLGIFLGISYYNLSGSSSTKYETRIKQEEESFDLDAFIDMFDDSDFDYTSGPLRELADRLSTAESLQDPNSPQWKALKWLYRDDVKKPLDHWPDYELLQRYVFAVFYYSTNGDQWRRKADRRPYWLIPDRSVCRWAFGIGSCLPAKNFTKLMEFGARAFRMVGADGLSIAQGTIPKELGALTHLTALRFSTNLLTSTIPSELGLLINLKYLLLDENQISGTIPSQLAQLKELRDLWLNNNTLSSTIPSELGLMSNHLKALRVNSNRLTGTIPNDLTQLTKLNEALFDSNNLIGKMPDGFCQASFPDWRRKPAFPSGKDQLHADCVDIIKCDCCNACFDENGTCFDKNGDICALIPMHE
jgi:hypothetical protein